MTAAQPKLTYITPDQQIAQRRRDGFHSVERYGNMVPEFNELGSIAFPTGKFEEVWPGMWREEVEVHERIFMIDSPCNTLEEMRAHFSNDEDLLAEAYGAILRGDYGVRENFRFISAPTLGAYAPPGGWDAVHHDTMRAMRDALVSGTGHQLVMVCGAGDAHSIARLQQSVINMRLDFDRNMVAAIEQCVIQVQPSPLRHYPSAGQLQRTVRARERSQRKVLPKGRRR